MNRTSGLLISSYSFYLHDLGLFKWTLYEHLSLNNLSISLICFWLLSPSFFVYHYVRSKWKGNNRLNIVTILRADIVSSLKFLIKGKWWPLILAKFITHFNLLRPPTPLPPPKKKSWFPMTTPSPIKLCVWFFEVFRGLKIGTLAQNELNGWTRALPISIYYDPPRFVISN